MPVSLVHNKVPQSSLILDAFCSALRCVLLAAVILVHLREASTDSKLLPFRALACCFMGADMVDLAFGPEPGPRPDLTDTRQAYLHMARRKRLYTGVFLILMALL